jgi:hypothetical protein
MRFKDILKLLMDLGVSAAGFLFYTHQIMPLLIALGLAGQLLAAALASVVPGFIAVVLVIRSPWIVGHGE